MDKGPVSPSTHPISPCHSMDKGPVSPSTHPISASHSMDKGPVNSSTHPISPSHSMDKGPVSPSTHPISPIHSLDKGPVSSSTDPITRDVWHGSQRFVPSTRGRGSRSPCRRSRGRRLITRPPKRLKPRTDMWKDNSTDTKGRLVFFHQGKTLSFHKRQEARFEQGELDN